MQRLHLIRTAGPATILTKLNLTKRRNITLPMQNKMSISTSSTYRIDLKSKQDSSITSELSI